MRRDPRQVGDRHREASLPLRESAIVLGFWISGFVILAFAVVPTLFAMCGPAPGIT
jgi:hypothetical protein